MNKEVILESDLTSNALLMIIKHFGIKNQQKKLMEEIFELNEAISEYETILEWQGGTYFEEYNPEAKEEYMEHIKEEMADVLILINQIWEYYNFSEEEIDNFAKYKLTRTLDRIESGYYDKK